MKCRETCLARRAAWCSGLIAVVALWTLPAQAQQAGAVTIQPVVPQPQPATAAPVAGTMIASTETVNLDFNQVDLPTFVKFVSELTKANFAIDDRVKGKVTIYAPKKIPVNDVYPVFEQVLELKGFGLVPSENVTQVLPLTDMPPARDIYVYYLQNASAEEMAKVLTGIVSRSATPTPRRPGQPGQEFEGVVQILADSPTNSLIITSSPRDYEMIKSVLAKLDIKRRQVYVEAVIMEVSVKKDQQFGVNGFALQAPKGSSYTLFGGSSTLGTGSLFAAKDLATAINAFSGLSFGAVRQLTLDGNNFFSVGGLIQAVATDSDINVLSTPQILTRDNQKAEIVVGDNVPILTSTSQTGGGNFQTQIERRDVGITMRLTPQILESDLVKLDLYQEISSVRTDVSADLEKQQGVTTSKKSATTSVIVQDKQTVVIGGLMEDKVNDVIRKVPLLGDIPILGWLFKTKQKVATKTNLLIFLTPHVIRNPEELLALQQEKSMEMLGAVKAHKSSKEDARIRFLEQAINPPKL